MKKTMLSAALLLGMVCNAQDKQLFVNTLTEDALVASLSEAADYAAKCACGTTITINLAEGEYDLSSPLSFTQEQWGREDVSLVIRGAGMSGTVISGGVPVKNFTPGENGTWTADLGRLFLCGGSVDQLFIDGARANIAREPNQGYFKTPNVEQTPSASEPALNGCGFNILKMKLPAGAASKMSAFPGDMRCAFLHAWDASRRRVVSYSVKDSILFMAGRPSNPANKFDNCSQFCLENNIAFLDAAGEFFFDPSTNVLSYIPRKGENPGEVSAVVPVLRQLVIIKGSSSKPVCGISIEGISFRYTRHTMSWLGDGPQQAAASVDGTIMLDCCKGIKIESCEISCTGNNGICINEGCRDCCVIKSYIHDVGTGALKIGGFNRHQSDPQNLTSNITVDNNIFRDGSRANECGTGVLLLNASDCTITHNDISDFFYTGISAGWTWGYGFSPSKRNKIEFNHIHHIGWGVLSDMGGVYTLGLSEGTTVSNNVIHDVYSYGYGGWGLYTDEGSTGIVMENNLVYRCKSSGFHQHYGEDNIIRNNVFLDNIVAQLQATRVEEHNSYDFKHNVISYTEGDMFLGRWAQVKAQVDSNLYWRGGPVADFNGLDIEKWRDSTGKDRHSFIADPKLTGLMPTNRKALKKIGFKTFDPSLAGVYGDSHWLEKAAYDPKRDSLYQVTVRAYLSE